MKKVICDVETNALFDYTRLHLVSVLEVDSGKILTFREHQLNEFFEYAKGVTQWIGHNFIGFDYWVLHHFLPGINCRPDCIVDTLILGRLCNQNLEGGHSLEAWGNRFNIQKHGVDIQDWSEWTQEMEDRNKSDCRINWELYKRLLPFLNYKPFAKAIEVEHKLAFVCYDMRRNGFAFDIDKARLLYTEITEQIDPLEKQMVKDFLPKVSFVREITPKLTKKGTLHSKDFMWMGPEKDLSSYHEDQTFSLIEYIPFNPGSPKQVVERLNSAGWRPTEKTKGHITAEREADYEKLEHYRIYGWKISEENLSTLPDTAPEAAKKLSLWLTLNSRKKLLEGFFEAYNTNTGRIHGTIHPIGAWTHRAAHTNPNVGNIVRVKDDKDRPQPYGAEIRSLFRADTGRVLVGVDADSIQLRILAHYMDDHRFTTALNSGDKDKGTDAHSLNAKALGHVCKGRNNAKRFIYAWLLGAGVNKVSEILGCSPREAREAVDLFIGFYPGLQKLKSVTIPQDARKGYFVGLDGRHVVFPEEYKIISGYLQNGEKVIMAHANILWRSQLIKEGVPFWQVNWVHDEWQTETLNMELAQYIAKIQIDSIIQTGLNLNMKCPLAGEAKIGFNWLDTH